MREESSRFSPEVRDRAARMVQEHCGEYASLWSATESIAPKIGCVSQAMAEVAEKLQSYMPGWKAYFRLVTRSD
jgi:transposase